MSHEYDLFEKFADGSSLWRACVIGSQSARLYLRDLAQRSQNQFYAIHVVSGKTIFSDVQGRCFKASPKTGKRNETPVA